MKPSGKCTTCKFVNRCNVDTQTRAKVIECPYQRDFLENDSKVAHKKTKRL